MDYLKCDCGFDDYNKLLFSENKEFKMENVTNFYWIRLLVQGEVIFDVKEIERNPKSTYTHKIKFLFFLLILFLYKIRRLPSCFSFVKFFYTLFCVLFAHHNAGSESNLQTQKNNNKKDDNELLFLNLTSFTHTLGVFFFSFFLFFSCFFLGLWLTMWWFGLFHIFLI